MRVVRHFTTTVVVGWLYSITCRIVGRTSLRSRCSCVLVVSRCWRVTFICEWFCLGYINIFYWWGEIVVLFLVLTGSLFVGMTTIRFIRTSTGPWLRSTSFPTIPNCMRRRSWKPIIIVTTLPSRLLRFTGQTTSLERNFVLIIKTLLSSLNTFLTGWLMFAVWIMSRVFSFWVRLCWVITSCIIEWAISLCRTRWLDLTRTDWCECGLMLILQ